MRSRALVVFSLALVVLASGCFQIEQTFDLQKDMSGTANLKIGIDFEPMITIMAQMQHDMSGKKGAVTKQEIEAAKADFRKQQQEQEKKNGGKKDAKPEISRKDVEKDLPPGIKLLDLNVDQQEFSMTTSMKFAFDKLQHLVSFHMPSKEGAEADPTKKNVIETPFEGLQVTEKGDTITIQTKPQNPAEKVQEETSKGEGPKLDPDTEKLMKDAFKNLKVSYRITAPFQVVSSNATRREGNTLVWEYTMDTFEKMEKSKKPVSDLGVKVVYKK